MSSSPSNLNGSNDHYEELSLVIAELLERPDREAVASELQVLQSIYGNDAIRLWHPPIKDSTSTRFEDRSDEGTLRYEAELNLPTPHDDISVRILVSIPLTYPVSSPPQLQLLSRYIGAFGADSALFGSVLRTFISVNGVEWAPDTVCVFDGLTNVVERCAIWYQDHLRSNAGEQVREDTSAHPQPLEKPTRPPPPKEMTLPEGLELFTAEPITDRKSVFVGRACRIMHPSQVPLVLSYLMTDRRISRAAHPIINAWRCQIGTLIHQDNDDDGETAAGGRIAHLLQILEVNNVLIVVTRYFGGIHLGPDRFKHINQAARSALELGGFLEVNETKRNPGRGKRH